MRRCAYSFLCVCKCCDCEICCKCCPLSECCKIKEDLSEFNNRNEAICISYKISGICAWFCSILWYYKGLVLYIALSIILFEVLHIGFKPYLFDHIENYDGNTHKNFLFYIHLIYLSGIMIFYFINILIGYLFSKCVPLTKMNGESVLLGYGLILFLIIGSIISSIISVLIFFQKISEDFSCYLITFSLSCYEYYKLLMIISLSQIADHIELLSYTSIISLFLSIYKIIIVILEVFNFNKMNLIIFQFILGMIIIFCAFFILLYFIIIFKILKIKKIEDVDKVYKEMKQKQINSIKEKKEENEALIKEEQDNLLIDIMNYNREHQNEEEDN